MLVVNRFQVPEDEAEAFRADLESALAVLSEQVGYAEGQLGRNVDDPTLWTMVTTWKDVGSYRRALSQLRREDGRRSAAEQGDRRALGVRVTRRRAEHLAPAGTRVNDATDGR